MSTIMNRAKSDVWKYFIKQSSTSARCVLCTKILKHGGNTTNLHNHYKTVHKMHVATKLPSTEPTLPKQLKMSDTTDTTKENKLNKEIPFTMSNSTMNEQGQLTSLIDNSSDIDDPVPCEQNSESSDSVAFTSSHSIQDLKFKVKHKAKMKETNCKITKSFMRINSFMDGGSLANKLTNCILFMIASENLPLSIVDSKAFKRLMHTAVPLYTVPSRKTITRLIDAKFIPDI